MPQIVGNTFDAAIGRWLACRSSSLNTAPTPPQRLLHGVVGELAPEDLFDLGLVLVAERFQVVGRQVGILGDALGLFHGLHEMLELNADALALGSGSMPSAFSMTTSEYMVIRRR